MRFRTRARSPRTLRSQRAKRCRSLGGPISGLIGQTLADHLSDELVRALVVIHADRDAGVVAIVELREVAVQMLL